MVAVTTTVVSPSPTGDTVAVCVACCAAILRAMYAINAKFYYVLSAHTQTLAVAWLMA